MMCGCMGKDKRVGLGFWVVVMLILLLMVAMGCAQVPVAPECPVQSKCPDTYVELYHEEQRAADRLEDALRASEEKSRACVRVFEDYQIKSR